MGPLAGPPLPLPPPGPAYRGRGGSSAYGGELVCPPAEWAVRQPHADRHAPGADADHHGVHYTPVEGGA